MESESLIVQSDIRKNSFMEHLFNFDEDTIKFIEVKTAQSQLSPKQRKIKKQIEDGKVEFLEVRY